MSDQHLSQIVTQWTMLFQAHKGAEDDALQARRELMLRYSGAVHRYLHKVVRDPHLADELAQEFAVRFMEGRFGHADPALGRFRSYVKTALFRLIHDYHRGRAQRAKEVPLGDDAGPQAPDEMAAAEEAFRESWRQDLLSRAWKALEAAQSSAGQPYYDILRLRVNHPEWNSSALAEHLTATQGKPYTAAGARQLLHRARERFSEFLLQEVRQTVEGASAEELREELADLRLLKYCQAILDQ